jgi:hypothetical protein
MHAPASRGQIRLPLGLVLLAVTLVGAGCSSYRKPRIVVGGALISETSAEAMRFDVGLDLSNSNAVPLELVEFKYSVIVDGRRAFTGRRSAQATLAPESSTQVTIPFIVRFDRMEWDELPPTARWSVSGRLLYIQPGELAEILLDTGVRRPKVSFSGRGEVQLADPAGTAESE